VAVRTVVEALEAAESLAEVVVVELAEFAVVEAVLLLALTEFPVVLVCPRLVLV